MENCADCFAEVTLADLPDETYNVVDDEGVAVMRHAATDMRARGLRGMRIPVPYGFAYGVTLLVRAVARLVFGRRAKLPSLFVPERFEARFKPAALLQPQAARGVRLGAAALLRAGPRPPRSRPGTRAPGEARRRHRRHRR